MAEAELVSEEKRTKSLRQLIAHEITHNQGKIDFAKFMHLALYSEYGYYQAKPHILGQHGDYTTAPEMTDLFAKCLAEQSSEILSALPTGNILEFGAGTGALAKTLLSALDKLHCLPNKYYIIEPSKGLVKLQQKNLQALPHKLHSKFVWVTEIPDNFTGILLANEVFDAMPVHRFRIDNHHIFEYYVTLDKTANFQWQMDEIAQGDLYDQCVQIKQKYLPQITNYSSECNLGLQPFLQQALKKIKEGVFIIIDYGYHAAEYYHPERRHGTLTCFYQHHHHDNPLLHIGNQDISAHVNFSALAQEAKNAGYEILGYTNQAAFLLNCNLLEKIAGRDAINLKQQVQTLTLPTEMGELMKVIAIAKNFSSDLLGFKAYNKRHYLLENL